MKSIVHRLGLYRPSNDAFGQTVTPAAPRLSMDSLTVFNLIAWWKSACGLQVKNEHRRFRARAARRELVVRCLLLGREIQVLVIGFTFQHAGDASATDALFARRRDLDTDCAQRVDHSLVLRHNDHAAGTG